MEDIHSSKNHQCYHSPNHTLSFGTPPALDHSPSSQSWSCPQDGFFISHSKDADRDRLFCTCLQPNHPELASALSSQHSPRRSWIPTEYIALLPGHIRMIASSDVSKVIIIKPLYSDSCHLGFLKCCHQVTDFVTTWIHFQLASASL